MRGLGGEGGSAVGGFTENPRTGGNKSEENGANQNKSGHCRKQGAQIGTNRKKTGKSEQIGVTPFCRPQSGGSDLGA